MFKMMCHMMFMPFQILFKLCSVLISFLFLFTIYFAVAMVFLPFYGIPIIVRLVRKFRAKRQDRPQRSRGIQIALTCFNIIGWLLFVMLLPFYGTYLIYRAAANQPKRTIKKQDDLSWIDRLEEYDAFFN